MIANQRFLISYFCVAALLSLSCPSGQSQTPESSLVSQQSDNQPNRTLAVAQWFKSFDQIRRQAQMSPSERSQADRLLTRGISPFTPEDEKQEATNLLTRLVARYKQAQASMRQLPLIPESQRLHRGYYQYFNTAGSLFSDYLTLQGNLFAKDPASGRPLASMLLERKQHLEELNNLIHTLDDQTRDQFNIPPYQYQSR